jgi:hypothetical protein
VRSAVELLNTAAIRLAKAGKGCARRWRRETTKEAGMDELNGALVPAADHLLAGALAHLAQHMASGCPRSAYLAALLLERIADQASPDSALCRHARQVVAMLECDPCHFVVDHYAVRSHPHAGFHRTTVRRSLP